MMPERPKHRLSMAELAGEMSAIQQRLAQHSVERPSAGTGLAAHLGRFIGRIGSRLTRPPRIIILGEFNSGKSTLANALIGTEVLPTSIHANTRVPLLIHFSDTPSLAYEAPDRIRRPLSLSAIEDLRRGTARMLHVGLPVECLKTFELIDTPGLASGSSGVDDLVLEASRRSHIAVWCTVATQAWKATEQGAWSALPQRLRQRSVLAVTHCDAIHSERDRQRLLSRLGAEASGRFGSVACASATSASGAHMLEQQLLAAIDMEQVSRQTAAERLLLRATERLPPPVPQARGQLNRT